MNFPCLVLDHFCNCIIDVTINSEGSTEDGGAIKHTYNNIKCNYQSKASTTYDDKQKIVNISGSCYIPGDPFIEEELSSGIVIVNGLKRNIVRGSKNRNPDNTVNYTLLELR